MENSINDNISHRKSLLKTEPINLDCINSDNNMQGQTHHSLLHSGQPNIPNILNTENSANTNTNNNEYSFETTSSAPHIFVESLIVSFSFVLFFSLLGYLIRIVIKLYIFNFEPISQTYTTVMVQITGGFIYGATVFFKNDILKLHPSLLSGIQSGLCGSITTFSGFSMDLFGILFLHDEDKRILIFYKIMKAIEYIIISFSGGFGSFIFGKHLSNKASKIKTNNRNTNNKNNHKKNKHVSVNISSDKNKTKLIHTYRFVSYWGYKLELLIVICAILVFAALILYASLVFEANEILWGLVFSPVGAILRLVLAKTFNRGRRYPFGTTIANLGGTLVYGLVFMLQHLYNTDTLQTLVQNNSNDYDTAMYYTIKRYRCVIYKAIMDGFCGCLTTFSTFIYELYYARNASYNRYVYLVLSAVIAQALLIVSVGTPFWLQKLKDVNNQKC